MALLTDSGNSSCNAQGGCRSSSTYGNQGGGLGSSSGSSSHSGGCDNRCSGGSRKCNRGKRHQNSGDHNQPQQPSAAPQQAGVQYRPMGPRCVSTLGRLDRHGLDRLGPLTHARAAWSAVRSPHSVHLPSVLSTSPGMGSGRADCSLNQISLQNQGWMMDSDALGHMSSTDLTRLPPSHSFITVGNDHTIPVSCRGTSILPASHFLLNNVLVVPLLASTCYRFASLLATTTVLLSLTLLVFL